MTITTTMTTTSERDLDLIAARLAQLSLEELSVCVVNATIARDGSTQATVRHLIDLVKTLATLDRGTFAVVVEELRDADVTLRAWKPN